MTPPAATVSGRLEFLDLIRGLFILVMVEGHTLRTLLDAEARASVLYRAQDLIHNLTGPAFLFASGAAFVYSTRGRWESSRKWSPRLRRRLLRWLGILVVGYGLQLTYGTLRRSLVETTPAQLAYLLSLNILQCIVLGLFLLQVLLRLAPNQRWFFRAAILGTVAIGLATPYAWSAGSQGPVWLGPLVSGRTQSIFPLFPYAGFTLAGAAWGHLHSLAREQSREDSFLQRTMRYCTWLCLACAGIGLLPLPQINSDFWYTSPQFFFLRVGILVLLAVAARRLEPRLLPRWDWLAMTGRESLVIYVLHLIVLYGSAFNPNTSLVKWFGTPQPAAQSILIWIVFTAALVLFAGLWSWWKRDHAWQAKSVQWTVAGYIAYTFLAG